MKLSKKLFIITGPSAVGKTTITRGLLETNLPLAKVLTTTSRSKRRGERDGKDYRFVAPARFRVLIRNKGMFEWAEFAGHHYGSQKRDVESIVGRGRYPIWVVDTQGADFLKKKYGRAKTIFVMPSSFSILRKRLEARKLPESEIRIRLKTAQAEIKKAPRYDYQVINYNGKLANVVDEVAKVIKREIG